MDMVTLLIGMLGIMVIVLLLSFFISDYLINNISYQQEQLWTQKIHQSTLKAKEKVEKTPSPLGSLVEQLWQPYYADTKVHIQVEVMEASVENAFMSLGGEMSVTSQLLKNSVTENELAFVVCHELGHFYHRDVLRGLGRGVVVLFVASALSFSQSNIPFLDVTTDATNLKFSRDQESRADEFALHCMQKKYGHIQGFDGFFNRIKAQNKWLEDIKWTQYMSTHPLTQERIDHLKSIAQKENLLMEGPLTSKSW